MKVLVTGANGLVGNGIRRWASYYRNFEFVFVTHAEADLTNEGDVEWLFSTHKPDYVIHAAAKVGGIGGNMMGQADYFVKNILMNTLVIDACYRHKVKKLLAFSSVCVFPDNLQVLQEDKMHDAPPFKGNFAYAHAKRMVDIHIQALRDQHGVENYCSIIPSNIIGTHDLYNLEHGHVLPSLIHKIYIAKKNGTDLKVWGDGKSLREFIFAEDLARVLLHMLELDSIPDRLTVAGDEQYSIRDMVGFLVEAADFKGEVVYDDDKPNGQRNRQSDLTRLNDLIPDFSRTPIKRAVKLSYDWFAASYPKVRK